MCRAGPLGRTCMAGGFGWLAGGLESMRYSGVRTLRAWLERDGITRVPIRGTSKWMLMGSMVVGRQQAQVWCPGKSHLCSYWLHTCSEAAAAQALSSGVPHDWLFSQGAGPGPGIASRETLPLWLLALSTWCSSQVHLGLAPGKPHLCSY